MKFTASTPAAAFAVLLLFSAPAHALSLEEAGVEKGEVELQYEATYTDKNAEGAYEHEEEIEVQMGLTDWLLLTVGFGFEEEEGERDFEFSELEGEIQVELIDPEKGGFGFAVFAGFSKEFAAESGEEDENTYKIGAIAEQHYNKWLFRGNLFYISDIDGDGEEEFDGVEYAYQVKYSVSEKLGVGVEGYGSHQEFDDPGEDDVDQHMVGPVLYYSFERGNDTSRHASIKDVAEIGGEDGDDEDEGIEFELQAGVLFGTTDDTADVTYKWGLEIEF